MEDLDNSVLMEDSVLSDAPSAASSTPEAPAPTAAVLAGKDLEVRVARPVGRDVLIVLLHSPAPGPAGLPLPPGARAPHLPFVSPAPCTAVHPRTRTPSHAQCSI